MCVILFEALIFCESLAMMQHKVCNMMQHYMHAFDLSLVLSQFLLVTSRSIYSPRFILFYLDTHELSYIIALVGKYDCCLMTLFSIGRTWTSYLSKLKQLKGDTVCLKQLACPKFMDCQLHLCILLAVRETIIQLLP